MKENRYEIEHKAAVRRLGAECAVLLKSSGAFPLDEPCEIALFGSGARRTVKGGTGSGEVNSRSYVTVEEGLKTAGFRISSPFWLDSYDSIVESTRKAFIRELKADALRRHTLAVIDCMGAVMPESEYNIPLTAKGDAAVYVLSRISGEGSDRRAVPGDILLTETEKRDILYLNNAFSKFLLVLNVGGVVDLSPVMEVKNILLLSQLGAETGHILADLLLGKSYPSGKLATTWSAWEDYPTIGEFGEKDDTRYREGIYVGYRYFDSVGKKPLFPFGFGLGYTEFAIKPVSASAEGEKICVEAEVKNIGTRPGRQVVQLYVSSPEGELDQPYQSLAAFAKTKELLPGESETLRICFSLRDVASFDEKRAAWVLEQGDYILRLGTSSAQTKPVAIVRLDGSAIVRQVKNCCGQPDFVDWRPGRRTGETPRFVRVLHISANDIPTETVRYDRPCKVDPAVVALSDEELAMLGVGDFAKGLGATSVVGEASRSVAGAAGETTTRLRGKGIPSLVMADGPAGLRLSREYIRDERGVHPVGETMPESVRELMPAPAAFLLDLLGGKKQEGERHEQFCTAIPIGTAIAQSWDIALAEALGDIVGDEMERFGVHLWLAPALNIHRDIRCGRNFEYFSEDPLLSGVFAAALSCGAQKHPGCGVTVKHFAANNQETNRYNNNSLVSERALREIYLRGFGIAVREGRPLALMTSYNLLNGAHTSERRDLIEDVLRAEFGFDGLVMTDWIIPALQGKKLKYPGPDAALISAAGNDLTMPGGKHDWQAILRGLRNGTLKRKQLEINATRIVLMAKRLAG